MKRLTCLTFGVILASMLVSCGTPTAAPSTAAPTPVPPTATRPDTTVAVDVEATQEPVRFPLSEPGPYYTGKRTFTFEDPSRDGRQIGITVLYPAVQPEGSTGAQLLAGADRDPDLSSAPYPLILTGPDTGSVLFKAHLVSHGFAMAIVRYPDSYDYWDFQMVDHPRDILFALDQIASQPLEGLEGVVDSDHVGVAGYSSDGDHSLAVSGVRVDPGFYISHCEQAPAIEPALSERWIKDVCNPVGKWDEFVSHVGDEITVSDDGLWQPLTDERIRAVMLMSSGGAWLYGDRGLSAADSPVFIIAAPEDDVVPYQIEAAYIFEHLGSPERFMVSFIGKGHMMVFDPEQAKRLNHFATAFFGTYLQDKSEYRDYFSEEFVSQFDDLAWGVYEGE
jgi:predicted dienelactone hydrolase